MNTRPATRWSLSTLCFVLFATLSTAGSAPSEDEVPDLVCPPCGHACLETSYEQPGSCPICGMSLVTRSSLEADTASGAEVPTTVPFRFRDVVVDAGDVSLEARFYLPDDASPPLAAAVVNHGSAPTRFDQVSFFVATSLEAGLAVLAYSKRGCGGSTGSYRRFNVEESTEIFDELASDATAALRWVKAQPEVDPARVGFFGGSQAGWISPLAASREPAAFIINVAGTPLSAGEEAFHGRLVGDGHGPMRSVSTEEADRRLSTYTGPRGFDPRPILEQLQVDTLWIFGTRDEVIPVRASIAALERLRVDGNRHHHIEVAEGYNHNMAHVETGEPYDTLTLIREWLIARGVLTG